MNERQERTADVLGKLTVLGTIVLPMNIICGMWGMNVKVPGQEIDNLYWFWSSMLPLTPFPLVCMVLLMLNSNCRPRFLWRCIVPDCEESVSDCLIQHFSLIRVHLRIFSFLHRMMELLEDF